MGIVVASPPEPSAPPLRDSFGLEELISVEELADYADSEVGRLWFLDSNLNPIPQTDSASTEPCASLALTSGHKACEDCSQDLRTRRRH